MSIPAVEFPQSATRTTRRLSSIDASRKSLSQCPTVVAPPKHLLAPSEASEVASAIEIARHELADDASSVSSFGSSSGSELETLVTDKYAFAFDIDGVLIRGGKVIPEAVEAMRMLNGKNDYGIKMYA
jgi:hypothetical protein